MRHTRVVVTHYGGPDSLRVVSRAQELLGKGGVTGKVVLEVPEWPVLKHPA